MALKITVRTVHKSPQHEEAELGLFAEEQRFLGAAPLDPDADTGWAMGNMITLEPLSLSDELRASRHPDDEYPLTGVAAEVMRGEIARTGAATDTEVEEVEAHTIGRFLNPMLPALPTDFYEGARDLTPEEMEAIEEVLPEERGLVPRREIFVPPFAPRRGEEPPEFEPELRFGPPPPKREPESFRWLERTFGERRTTAAPQGSWGSPGRSAPAFAPEPPPSFGITAIGPGVAGGLRLGPVGITTGIQIPTLGINFTLEMELRRRGAFGR